MRFKEVVEAICELRAAYEPGIQALRKADRARLDCGDTGRLAGSVDLDSTLAASLPNEPRWDYGIAVDGGSGSDRVHWVEVHQAHDGAVKEVLRKHAWLKSWLSSHGPDLLTMTAGEKGYVWVATKDIGFQRGSPKAKQLYSHGLTFPTRRFCIP